MADQSGFLQGQFPLGCEQVEEKEDISMKDPEADNPLQLDQAELQERDHVEALAGPPILPRNPPSDIDPNVRKFRFTSGGPMAQRHKKQGRIQAEKKRQKQEDEMERKAREAREMVRKIRINNVMKMVEYKRYPLDEDWYPAGDYEDSQWGNHTYWSEHTDGEPSFDKNERVAGIGPPRNEAKPARPSRSDILQDEFMASDPILKVSGVGGWKARKFLGMGGMGLTGLWEYTGLDEVPHKYLVVKQSRTSKDGARSGTAAMAGALMEEGQVMHKWQNVPTNHLVKIVWGPAIDESGAGRIMMEYCDEGDLRDYIKRQIHSPNGSGYFSEEEIWQIFMCLAEGCSVLAGGYEYGKAATEHSESSEGWGGEICHFDIKPQNIFLTRDSNHMITPLSKIADHGLANVIPEHFGWIDRICFRGCGTWGYFSPEQFTDRWNCKGWDSWEIASNFGSKTNIWQCAAVIMQMMTRGGPPPIPRSYRSNYPEVQGRTYGPEIEKTNYSDSLKILVLQCLCEDPAYRPNADQLNYQIRAGIAAMGSVSTMMELNSNPYEDSNPYGTPADTPGKYPGEHMSGQPSDDPKPSDGLNILRPKRKKNQNEQGLMTPDNNRRGKRMQLWQ